MVKLFDFKFLILLGLAIIIYLLYREIESQRVKIQECENKILSLTNIVENKKEPPKNILQSTFDILTLRKEEAVKEHALEIALNQENNNKQDNLHLSLPSEMLIENTSDSETSKNTPVHLEVYSNDSANDSKNIFTTIPSIAASFVNKCTSLMSENVPSGVTIDEFFSGRWREPDFKISNHNKHDKIDVVNTEPVVENTEPVVENTEPVVENAEPVVENTEPVVENAEPVVENTEPVVENTEPVVENVKVIEDTKPVIEITKPVVENVEPVVENVKVIEDTKPVIEITKPVVEQPKYNITNLLKMKISELQEIAKQRNISIDKYANGVVKNKTKQELAQEIL
jgi:hypothetical protein